MHTSIPRQRPEGRTQRSTTELSRRAEPQIAEARPIKRMLAAARRLPLPFSNTDRAFGAVRLGVTARPGRSKARYHGEQPTDCGKGNADGQNAGENAKLNLD